MATSPNYGWSEPDNTSLVKDGAQAMRTLGDAIDTSVWNVGFGQAGKNKIINGNFSVNQRSFTSSTSASSYTFDRWLVTLSGATGTYSAQTFTLGAAPVAGYEAANFLRLAVTVGNDNARIEQKIEDVRTFAGQTVTLSFWAKGTNPTTAGNLKATLGQDFGSGGSLVVSEIKTFVLTANWVRYSLTYTLGSMTGKTIGTNSNVFIQFGQSTDVSAEAWTLDLWGVQMEYGSKATPFQTASGGSIQGELAMCQRYFYNPLSGNASANVPVGSAFPQSTTVGRVVMKFPVTMRTPPSYAFGTIGNWALGYPGGVVLTSTTSEFLNNEQAQFVVGTTGLTATQVYQLYRTNTTDTLLFSAEL
jgi:hypothetical protein